jgi:hypothetical protein
MTKIDVLKIPNHLNSVAWVMATFGIIVALFLVVFCSWRVYGKAYNRRKAAKG